MGPEVKQITYRFATSDGPRGGGERRYWAALEKEKGPSSIEGFFLFKQNSAPQEFFGKNC